MTCHVVLTVENSNTKWGECIGVVGEGSAFGAWTTPVLLSATKFPKWTAEIGNLTPGSRYEYKYVLVENGAITCWENEGVMENRSFIAHNNLVIYDGGFDGSPASRKLEINQASDANEESNAQPEDEKRCLNWSNTTGDEQRVCEESNSTKSSSPMVATSLAQSRVKPDERLSNTMSSEQARAVSQELCFSLKPLATASTSKAEASSFETELPTSKTERSVLGTEKPMPKTQGIASATEKSASKTEMSTFEKESSTLECSCAETNVPGYIGCELMQAVARTKSTQRLLRTLRHSVVSKQLVNDNEEFEVGAEYCKEPDDKFSACEEAMEFANRAIADTARTLDKVQNMLRSSREPGTSKARPTSLWWMLIACCAVVWAMLSLRGMDPPLFPEFRA